DPDPHFDQADTEEQHERSGNNPHQWVDFLGAALGGTDEDVGDEASTDAVGDRVGEWHQGEGQESRQRNAPVIPVDLGDLGDHHETDDYQRRGDGFERHQIDQRAEEHRYDHQQAGDYRG